MRLDGIRARRKQGYGRSQRIAFVLISGSEPTVAGLRGAARQSEVAGRYRANRNRRRVATCGGGIRQVFAPDCGLVYETEGGQPTGYGCPKNGFGFDFKEILV